jgi:hypothetical protein
VHRRRVVRRDGRERDGADRVYKYDYGKLVAWRDKDGHRAQEFFHDLKTHNLKETWRVDAAYFAREMGWTTELVKARPLSREAQQRWLLRALYEHEQKSAVAPDEHPDLDECCPAFAQLWARLREPEHGLLVDTPGVLALAEKGKGYALEITRKYRKELPKDRDFKIHVGPIATGDVVQKDPELFNRLEKLVRKTLGAEMEAAAIGLVGDQLDRQAIIVKAVSDYGDGDKDDAFRAFAARASAEVLIRFLLRKLTPSEQELDDRQDVERRASADFSFLRTDSARGDDLLPVRFDLRAFRYMLAEGRIALLFDGFDELALRVSYERAVEHFATLIQAAQGEAKVVITSRTQHFFSDQQVKLALAEQASNVKGYRLAKLQPFSKAQIQRFLVKRLGNEDEKRFRLLDEVQDLLGLSHNPRMNASGAWPSPRTARRSPAHPPTEPAVSGRSIQGSASPPSSPCPKAGWPSPLMAATASLAPSGAPSGTSSASASSSQASSTPTFPPRSMSPITSPSTNFPIDQPSAETRRGPRVGVRRPSPLALFFTRWGT